MDTKQVSQAVRKGLQKKLKNITRSMEMTQEKE